jgi:predicted O-methyltransferase YrrM
MRGSKFVKALRLAAAHARQPRYARRYLANLFVPPIASGLPWFTFSAIEFLEAWIKPHHEVFEYGCGGSTLFFAKRAKSVASVEHNAKWARSVTATALKRGLANVAIEVREAGREPPLADSPYCLALDRPFDIVVVDGWALGKCNEADRRAVQSRDACFRRAEQFVRPGGIIVLDDAWFDPDIAHRARDRRVFSGTGPWRIGASRTDVFFY